jgi:hypothetical protein
MDKITTVTIQFKGKKKGDKDIGLYSELIERIFDKDYKLITPENSKEYEHKAWNIIDSLGYTDVFTGTINVSHGNEPYPKQKQFIMRSIL